MSAANLKRLESIKRLKERYQNQKSTIKAALSNVDSAPKNRIVFDDTLNLNGVKETSVEINKSASKNDKKTLFNESDSEGDYEPNFTIQEHFQGKQGQKLLELQSRYKNDKRFALDERFLENEEDTELDPIENENISLEEEKKKEYEILEQVLGEKLVRKQAAQTTKKKSMIRYDPSNPEHSKYEIVKPLSEKKEKKKKTKNTEIAEEKKVEEAAAPEVSKEIFYKIPDNLKQAFEEKNEFSLLSMFGQQHEAKGEDEDVEMEPETSTSINKTFQHEKNPFKYDSSDEEDVTEDTPTKSIKSKDEVNDTIRNEQNTRNAFSTTDSLFFKHDDYRLQEGLDFVKKLTVGDQTEFAKLRQDLKRIVKAKVKNNLRKNKPFKKKLGGNRKRKVLKIKKAIKR